MSTSTWDPQSNTRSYTLELAFLKKVILLCHQSDEINVQSLLTQEEQKQHSPIMQLPKESWFSLTDALSKEDIITLIKFFTVAETQLTEWSGEEHSPVIWLSKILRKQGNALDKELLVWIKSTSKNKFLPYGAL